MVTIPLYVDEALERELTRCQEQFNDLKSEASDVRKNGRDTFFFDTKMLDFVYIMKMARTTYDTIDVEKAKRCVEDLRRELSMAKAGEPFEHALLILSQITASLAQGDTAQARGLYLTICDIYKILTHEEKNLIAEACSAIREKILHAASNSITSAKPHAN